MENDISVEQASKYNTLKEQKLRKMKEKIQALQMKKSTKASNSRKQVQPITVYDNSSFETKDNKSPINTYNGHNQFGYNSTLFQHIANESQPIMNNGSGVSNFSSVSNINQLLNGHHNFGTTKMNNMTQSIRTGGRASDKIEDDITRILAKIQKSKDDPNKAPERNTQNKERKFNKAVIPQQSITGSKYSLSHGRQKSQRSKAQQYKEFIAKMGTINEQQPTSSHRQSALAKKEQKRYSKTHNFAQFQQQLISYRQHQRQPSSLTYKTQYPMSDNYRQLPPAPPATKMVKTPLTGVQKQKMLLKQSVQQKKKLETESSHDIMDHSEIDFELSDDEQRKEGPQEHQQIAQLLKQKKQLQMQLQEIEQQLQQLQN